MIDEDPAVEARILAGRDALARSFAHCRVFADHFALVDDAATRNRILWLKRNRKELYDGLRPAIVASWARGQEAAAGKQGALGI